MSLENQRVEIKVSEPFSWPFGRIFGYVYSIESSASLIVKLDLQIGDEEFKSNWALLTIRNTDHTFDDFSEGCKWVNGQIISEDRKTKQFPFMADVCIVK